MVDRQERDDALATWGPQKSGTMVSSVLRDSSSGHDVVRDCQGEVCGDAVRQGCGGTSISMKCSDRWWIAEHRSQLRRLSRGS